MWSLKSDTLLKGKKKKAELKKAQKETTKWTFWTHKNLFRREQFAQKTRLIDLQMDSVESTRHALSHFTVIQGSYAPPVSKVTFLLEKKKKQDKELRS